MGNDPRFAAARVPERAKKSGISASGEFNLRLYTGRAQLRKLIAAVPEFELCDIYDFWYDIDDPLKLSNEMSDTVFILRKK